MVITPNNIPQGYKSSPLGIIPQEWEVKRLRDLCCNQGDYGINAPAVAYSKNLPTYLRITDISDDGKFIIDNKASVNSPNSESYHLKEGDIVFARTGATVGKTYLYDSADGDLVFAGFLIRFSPNKQKIIPYYLKTYTNTVAYWRWVKITSQRSGQPGINAAEYSSLLLPVPPLAEQQKIVEILGTWDKAIEKQSQLIEQLILRKRGLMQQLLSAKRRLPGFSDPWKVCIMQQLFTPVTTVNDGKPHLPMTISAKLGLISQQNKFDRVIAGDSLKKYTLIRYGDFAYNKGNSNLYEMGCIYQLKEKSALVPFVYICFRAKESVCGDFYQQYFLNHGLDRQLKRIITSGARGDGLLNVDKKDFFSLKIIYPSFEEQTAIAEVLTAADREIELAQQKLELLRQQKRGLMQQLLTGKKRVKV